MSEMQETQRTIGHDTKRNKALVETRNKQKTEDQMVKDWSTENKP